MKIQDVKSGQFIKYPSPVWEQYGYLDSDFGIVIGLNKELHASAEKWIDVLRSDGSVGSCMAKAVELVLDVK